MLVNTPNTHMYLSSFTLNKRQQTWNSTDGILITDICELFPDIDMNKF